MGLLLASENKYKGDGKLGMKKLASFRHTKIKLAGRSKSFNITKRKMKFPIESPKL